MPPRKARAPAAATTGSFANTNPPNTPERRRQHRHTTPYTPLDLTSIPRALCIPATPKPLGTRPRVQLSHRLEAPPERSPHAPAAAACTVATARRRGAPQTCTLGAADSTTAQTSPSLSPAHTEDEQFQGSRVEYASPELCRQRRGEQSEEDCEPHRSPAVFKASRRPSISSAPASTSGRRSFGVSITPWR